jgi:hypothetical protein
MPLPDPARSQAVLIGCAAYDHLEALPAVVNNLVDLAQRLSDRRVWGLPKERCQVLADPRSPFDVLDVVEEAANEATDGLVVYFAGHGLRDPRNSDLYLGLSGASARRLRRGIRYDDMRSIILDATRCASKVVILDCCYSGAAMLGGMGGADSVADQARIEGTFLFTAAAETKLALAPAGERHTAFTGEILRALTEGITDGGQLLDLETLYRHVRRCLEEKRRPVPQYRAVNNGTMIALGRNLLWRKRIAEPPRPVAPLDPLDDRVLRLRSDGYHRTADNALLSAGGLLELAELFEIMENLRRQRRNGDITKLVDGTHERTLIDLADLVCWLDLHELAPQADALMEEVIRRPADAVAKFAFLLSERDAQQRLGELLDHVAATPKRLVELLKDLPNALSGAFVEMLEHRASLLPFDRLPALADAMRKAGRTEYANLLIMRAADHAATLPLKELVALITSFGGRRHTAQRDLLLRAAYRATSDPRSRMSLQSELRRAGKPDLVRRAIDDAAQTFSEPHLAELLDTLDDAGEPGQLVDLCTAIADRRTTDGLAAIVLMVPQKTAAGQARVLLNAVRAVWPPAGDATMLREILLRTPKSTHSATVEAFLSLRKGNPQHALSLLARESPVPPTVENVEILAHAMTQIGSVDGLTDLLAAAAQHFSGHNLRVLGQRLGVPELAILTVACLDAPGRNESRDRAMIDLYRMLRSATNGLPQLIRTLGNPSRLESFFASYGPAEYAAELRTAARRSR